MDPAVFDNAFVLTGPTASGKTAVGLLLAERLGAEIISMDSMALYRGMDVGTAKPTDEERRRVRHHLIDVLDPWQPASLAWWLEQAAACVRDIQARGRNVLFVGGTPLYLKGLLRGIFEGPPGNPELRRRLEAESGPTLHERLQEVDPATARRLHPNDVRRLVRALEVHEQTGRPISDWQQQFNRVRPRRHLPIWLDLPRDALYRRIDQRVEHMLANGLSAEVKQLAESPRPLGKEARQALGYKELFDHLTGRCTLDEAKVLIQTRSRQFAKRQMTWFRHLDECRAVAVSESEAAPAIADRIAAVWNITSRSSL